MFAARATAVASVCVLLGTFLCLASAHSLHVIASQPGEAVVVATGGHPIVGTDGTTLRPAHIQQGARIGNATTARSAAVAGMAIGPAGVVVTAANATYSVDKLDWNQRRQAVGAPLAVVYCYCEADVVAAMQWATALPGQPAVTARAGRHSYEGFSVSNATIVIDVSNFTTARVDEATNTAVFGAGVKLIDVYDIAIRHNRSFAGGTCPTVGLAGFLLGGGYGFYSRLWGMASDQLISATVVAWNASVVVANATSHPDLYWALRGGGNGNYGIVMSFTVKLHDPPGTAAVYTIEWPTNATSAAVIAAWQSWAPRLSPRMTSQLEVYGGGIVHSAGQLMGSPAELRRLLQPLSSIGSPNVTISEKSYQALVLDYAGCDNMTACLAERDWTPAASSSKWKAKTAYVYHALSSDGIDTLLRFMGPDFRHGVPGYAGLLLDSYGGAIQQVPSNATAFYHRDALYHIQFLAYWGADTGAKPSLDWLDSFYTAMQVYLPGHYAYRNYCDRDIVDFGHAYYGDNYSRLQQVKAAYDPRNVFRYQQAIQLQA